MNEHTLSISIPAGTSRRSRLPAGRRCAAAMESRIHRDRAFGDVTRLLCRHRAGHRQGHLPVRPGAAEALGRLVEFSRFPRDESVGTREKADGTTTVTHSFQNSGPVATLLGSAFATVAQQRLTRLSHEVLSRRAVRTAAQN